MTLDLGLERQGELEHAKGKRKKTNKTKPKKKPISEIMSKVRKNQRVETAKKEMNLARAQSM